MSLGMPDFVLLEYAKGMHDCEYQLYSIECTGFGDVGGFGIHPKP